MITFLAQVLAHSYESAMIELSICWFITLCIAQLFVSVGLSNEFFFQIKNLNFVETWCGYMYFHFVCSELKDNRELFWILG